MVLNKEIFRDSDGLIQWGKYAEALEEENDKLELLFDNAVRQLFEERLKVLKVVYMSEEDKEDHIKEIKRIFRKKEFLEGK